ncbi:PWWP domain-containing DNA repair factor 3A isoform X1 [Nycticebus coucang]|uniref:PWWP domain-containing DNA repair factor 3A isoform X1 n=1 Tax=Nycticebus coucang TaxID=9470 RepID=UPI00234C1B07|nr:PWWP domain-containing DNA repair factor 3A isoform X1 [Nycticebus coucang]XP_053437296.1 PWWP domain-containing DNA repair factor 3A isoform X1 [Nycticebus coucang]XP_053437299.1 PWWP domain-containing DNA repair factor 3A isoform X1 [Nycticebus coucang]XP_053437303.1 PWWP domain-containing DNA repair factor 3A isoform X1 [Nycticebus coucang]XP_053437304.1 PWWP domain-containing DNA repair factor 3A isoform X1 [Nycticebus coucang]
MADAKYVLCRWEKRLWPAKVLTRTETFETSTKNKRKNEFFLDVQILSLEEKIKVRSTEVEVLKKSQIEAIASSLVLSASRNEVPAAPVEELTYRRSLRVALDVLNERTSMSQEGCSRTEGTALSQREKQPTEPDASLYDSSFSGPQGRRECIPQSPSALSACEKDPNYKVNHKKGLRKSAHPRGPSVSSAFGGSQDGSRSRMNGKNCTIASKRGRNSAQKSSSCQNVPSLSEADYEKESERKASSCTTLFLPSRVSGEDPCARARERNPCLPLGSVTMPTAPVHLACSEAGECPVKRPCTEQVETGATEPELSPRHGPRECMTLLSTTRLSPPPLQASTDERRSLHLSDSKKLEEDLQSSEESMEFNSINSILDEDEDDEEPPRILLYHEPRSFEVGMLVWLKYQKYPFWPAVVKSVRRRDKKASVLFIEGDMNPKGRGITVSLRRLKHFDCKEKQTLLNKAREDFDQAIGWCVSLITDYRVRLGCGSFSGSFLEYYAADISYPVRKSIQQDALGTRFPQLSKGSAEEPEAVSSLGRRLPCRKVLPDRSRAARDRANQKLVEYIVKARGTESHLRAILKSRRPSRWLETFLSSSQAMTCVETYLEDEEQLDLVVKYLQGFYQELGGPVLTRAHGDRIRFVLDVLLPEAIICAISAVDAVDYKTAEEKYIKGPSLSYREKEMFDNQLLEERNRRHR